jgi:SAM-dependent methyltransferase
MRHLPPEAIEDRYVHTVYDEIARHFDHTRYKPWPGVAAFVSSIAAHSLLLDLGCGNGRNLCINASVVDVGSDISMPLCQLAGARGRPILCASALSLPIRDSVFDHAICVAVIHHFASAERRARSLRELARILRRGGTAFVTAWATRQPRREYAEPDQMVPWHIHPQFRADAPRFQRFYHFFGEGEFAALLADVPVLRLVSERWEEGNWEVVLEKVA